MLWNGDRGRQGPMNQKPRKRSGRCLVRPQSAADGEGCGHCPLAGGEARPLPDQHQPAPACDHRNLRLCCTHLAAPLCRRPCKGREGACRQQQQPPAVDSSGGGKRSRTALGDTAPCSLPGTCANIHTQGHSSCAAACPRWHCSQHGMHASGSGGPVAALTTTRQRWPAWHVTPKHRGLHTAKLPCNKSWEQARGAFLCEGQHGRER